MSVWIPGEGYAGAQTAWADEMARRRVAAGSPPVELKGPYAAQPIAPRPPVVEPVFVFPAPVIEELASETPAVAVEAPAPEPAPWAPESAKVFLARRLAGGEAVAAATLTHEAAAYGFTERALRHESGPGQQSVSGPRRA
jgi:hypothetical protein